MKRLRVLLMANIRWDNAVVAYAIGLAKSLENKGHAVRFIVAKDSPALSRLTKQRFSDVHTITLRTSNPLKLISENLKAKKLISEFNPDIVNVFHSRDHQCAVLALGLGNSRAHIVSTRGVHRPPKYHPLNSLLYNKLCASHVACADFIADDHLSNMGLSKDNIKTIRPGFNISEFTKDAPSKKESRALLGIDPGIPLIGLIGRFTAHKGHKTLLEAISKLERQDVNVLFSGIEYDLKFKELSPLIEKLGLTKRVHFYPGKLPDVRVLISASDIITVPSDYSEAISRIAIEALALGVPVIGSNINSLPEILGSLGRLVPPGNANELAKALNETISNKEFYKHSRKEGPERIKTNYSLDKKLELTERLYLKLCESARQNPRSHISF